MDMYIDKHGNKYKITGYIIEEDGKAKRVPKGTPDAMPLIDFPWMSDYKYQLMCLNDRLKNPEKYAEIENVPETIAQLRKWLEEHKPRS